MQTRIYFGLGILILFLVGGLFTAAQAQRICAPISQQLEKACDYAFSGQLETASQLASMANRQWEKHWNLLAIVADHGPMDEIDGLFAQANMYAKLKSAKDFSATCARLSKLVEAIAEAHRLTWWNLV